jgi:hypothetical protein
VLRRSGRLERELERLGASVEWIEYDESPARSSCSRTKEIDFGGPYITVLDALGATGR